MDAFLRMVRRLTPMKQEKSNSCCTACGYTMTVNKRCRFSRRDKSAHSALTVLVSLGGNLLVCGRWMATDRTAWDQGEAEQVGNTCSASPFLPSNNWYFERTASFPRPQEL